MTTANLTLRMTYEERYLTTPTAVTLPTGSASTFSAIINAPPSLHFAELLGNQDVQNLGDSLVVAMTGRRIPASLSIELKYQVDTTRLGREVQRVALMTVFIFTVPWVVILLSRLITALTGERVDLSLGLDASAGSAVAVLMGIPVLVSALVVTRESNPVSQAYTGRARDFALVLVGLMVLGACVLSVRFPPAFWTLPVHIGWRVVFWTLLTWCSWVLLLRALQNQRRAWR